MLDIRELGGHIFNQTRGAVTFYLFGTEGAFDTFSATDVINTMAYSLYLSEIVTIDHENTIKSYSLSPSTLRRGHALLDPGGPVWFRPLRLTGQRADSTHWGAQVVSVSDYHPQLRDLRSALRMTRVVRRMAYVGRAVVAML